MGGWTYGRTERRTERLTDGRTNGQAYKQTDRQMNGLTDVKWTGGLTDRWMNVLADWVTLY
jgi:hypothetical protein